MKLEMRRVILFTTNMPAMTSFYRDIIGLEALNTEDGWIEFSAGACNIALHRGKSSVGARPPKLVFFAADVASARAALLKRGLAAMGRVNSTSRFDLCDGKDPDGNAFQISSRG